jgi:hypothetical protein
VIRDNYRIGIDLGMGDDMSCYQIFRTPGKLRRFLRRIHLDRSTWEYKLVSSQFVQPEIEAPNQSGEGEQNV